MKVLIKNKYPTEGLNLTAEQEEIMSKCVTGSSSVWTGFIDGKVACVWGVIPPTLLSDRVYLWLFTTDLIKDHQFIFVRHSQIVIKEILKDFDLIYGHCVVDAEHSIRWLKWLGAKFDKPEGKLVPFVIGKQNG